MAEHFFIARNNQQEGPYDLARIQAMVVGGQLAPETLCWYEGLPSWKPVSEVFPTLIGSAAPQTPVSPGEIPASSPTGHVEMEIIRSEFYQMPKITLDHAEVMIEAGAMHYMRGLIEMEAHLPSVGGFLKSKLTGEKAVRPRYRGSGEIYLEPTFGECHILKLEGEQWIIDQGAFLAAEAGVDVGIFTNKATAGLFGGEGFFQTRVGGRGMVLILAPGPIQRIDLVEERLVVDGSFAVARSPGLEYSVGKAAKGLLSTLASGEGIVSTFQGTGTILISPVPNRFLTLLREFGGLRAMIHGMSRG